jgi:hypothetical protein
LKGYKEYQGQEEPREKMEIWDEKAHLVPQDQLVSQDQQAHRYVFSQSF